MIFTTHTAVATRGGFHGFVIARQEGTRQGVKIWCETHNTRAKAMRAARKALSEHVRTQDKQICLTSRGTRIVDHTDTVREYRPLF